MRVSVIGTGYVGLVTGVGLAEQGHQVVCVDSDPEKIAKIQRGEVPFFERGLEGLLRSTLGTRLDATTDLRRAVLETELSLIAVGTPSREGGEIDLSSVEAVARQVGEVLRDKPAYHVVVVKSTVVPGTTEDVVLPLLEQAAAKRAGRDFGVGMNPEFLTEGEAVQDFFFPDRLVLGAIDERTHYTLDALYAGFPSVERVHTTPRTAEMIKYASNALLATLISFSNEVGNLCAALAAGGGRVDVAEVMRGLHLSKYLRTALPEGSAITAPLAAFLWPGCGFGGSCLPKDVQALIARGRQAGVAMPLLEAVIGAATPPLSLPAGRSRRRARSRVPARYERYARVAGHSDHPRPPRAGRGVDCIRSSRERRGPPAVRKRASAGVRRLARGRPRRGRCRARHLLG